MQSPVTHFFESEEVNSLSFDGAFINLHESSFPLYQEKLDCLRMLVR